MKEIRAYIQPHKLKQVINAVMDIADFPGMTVMDCQGFGRELTQPGQDYKPLLPKKRIEIFAPDHLVEQIFQTIMNIAHSGNHGDGKVYILDAISGGRVSSGETGNDLA